MITKLLLAGVVAAALVAAGCGGGGKGYALTAAEYGNALNKICEDVNAKQKEIGEPSSVEDVVKMGPELNQALQDGIDRARDLAPPDEIKDTVDEFLSKSQQQHDMLEDLIAAAEDGDLEKVQDLGGQVSTLGDETDALGKELGAPACAE